VAATMLVADIGGTHARFALAEDGTLGARIELPSRDFADLASAARAALAELRGNAGSREVAPTVAAIAVAGPVAGEDVELTNVGWSFGIEATRRALGLERLVVLNDLEAAASSLPVLRAGDLESWREGDPVDGAPRALIGVGTGLGTAALVETQDGRTLALAGEGGHRDLAASDEREWNVLGALSKRFDHVSAERAISGPGLASLYEALSAIEGETTAGWPAAEIVRRAVADREPRALEACSLLSGWLGAFAGDLVLTLGARGGLYLTGGVVPGMGAAFDRDRFFARLDGKGRFRDYLAAVPVRRIVSADAALIGAAAVLRRRSA